MKVRRRQREKICRLLREVCPFAPSLCLSFGQLIAVLFCLIAGSELFAVESVAATVNFSRDVRPILADNCFHCHGPDPANREADLRLDLWDAPDESAASSVIVAGDIEASELINRVFSEDSDEQMPPADSGKSLTDAQKTVLTEWIEQGAVYETHWAFVAPTRPQPPAVRNIDWVSNPIDSFVMAQLESEGLQPSPQAEPLALLRRLSLDLTGLPPTIEEIDRFQKQPEKRAYDRTVERLMASAHFGEKWAREWLDAARYADSDGYEKDLPREVWMYRDWVVNALNNDMPYDQFLIEQIAGDLLPDPTQSERIATGFMRNSMTNREGGIDPEQFRMEAMFDRMDAIGKSILGLTVQCAQCHTHKYDPLTQTDYYRMFAFLNNCDEGEIAVYTDAQDRQRQEVLREIAEIETELKRSTPDWKEQMAKWEHSLGDLESEWHIVRPDVDSSGGQKHYLLADGSILAQGYAPPTQNSEFKVQVELPRITAVRLELLNDPNLPRGGPGRSLLGLCALSEIEVEAAPMDESQDKIEVNFSNALADVNPEKLIVNRESGDTEQLGAIGPVSLAIDDDESTAWGIDVGPGRSNVSRVAVFILEEPLESSVPLIIKFTLKQSHKDVESNPQQTFNLGRFRLSLSSTSNPTANPVPQFLREILRMPASQRTPAQVDQVFGYWRTTVSAWKVANERIEAVWKQHPQGHSQLVLHERKQPRKTWRLDRGSFLNPAEEVLPTVPEFLHSLEVDSPSRLDFARWLADRRSPTTARAVVNRIWQSYFGAGLVETPGDFGLQGDLPTHASLLDWLAVELMDHHWSLKHIHRLIVNSSTYRQQSIVTEDLLERDPANKLLCRGPRNRLDAEIVRDVALTASGLLDRTVGGPSVFPPAPEFLFVPPASYENKSWPYQDGTQQFRRSLYVFRFRSVPHPVLETFDAPSGNISCVRRSRSNTPLQALTTLNEPLFYDCACGLAEKMLELKNVSEKERLTHAFRRCLTRSPRDEEIEVLLDFLSRQKTRILQINTGDKQHLATEGGKLKSFQNVESQPKQAAWIALARVLLNLDETFTNE